MASVSPFVAAHTDPLGDVNPSVVAEDGVFAIYFSNNHLDWNSRESPFHLPMFRTLVSATGEVLEVRKRVDRAPRPTVEPEFSARCAAGSRPEVAIWRNHAPDKRFRPHWPHPIVSGVEARLALADRTILSISYGEPEGDDWTKPLPQYIVDIDFSTKELRQVELGTPSRIYTFPKESSMVRVGDAAFLSWISFRFIGERIVDGVMHIDGEYHLWLSRYDLKAQQLKHHLLEKNIPSNNTPSIAAINETILIADHGSGAIKWRLVDVNKIAFKSAASAGVPGKGELQATMPAPENRPAAGGGQPATRPESK